MSNEISEWISKIQKGIWDSFALGSKDVMNAWAVFIVSRMKTGQSYPAVKPPAIQSGRLVRAIQGGSESSDDGIVDDSTIVYERTIRVPYAWMIEEGGNVAVTSRMKSFFLWKYSQTKEKKWKYMAFAGALKHPPLDYIKDSIMGMTVDKIEPAISRHLEIELNKIPNLEVVIGNK